MEKQDALNPYTNWKVAKKDAKNFKRAVKV